MADYTGYSGAELRAAMMAVTVADIDRDYDGATGWEWVVAATLCDDAKRGDLAAHCRQRAEEAYTVETEALLADDVPDAELDVVFGYSDAELALLAKVEDEGHDFRFGYPEVDAGQR